jgi:exodeoxyribonuclease VII small subunit
MTKARREEPQLPSFEESVAEIEAILEEIESAELPIDALAPRVERAATLIRHCRGVLSATETRVAEALDALAAELSNDA